MRTFFSGCLLFIVLCSDAQPFNQSISAKSLGYGDASVAYVDHWALFNNVGGIARINTPVSVFSVSERYQLRELTTVSAGLLWPFEHFATGITANRFGGDLYVENQLGIAFGHQILSTSWGIKINYLHQQVIDQPTKHGLIIEFGGMIDLSEELTLGVYMYNIQFDETEKGNGITMPVTFRTGFHFKPNEKFSLMAQIEKSSFQSLQVNTGMQYQFHQSVYASTGFLPQAKQFYFGIGYQSKALQIDYAFQNHISLGLSHLISFSYFLKKNDEKGDNDSHMHKRNTD